MGFAPLIFFRTVPSSNSATTTAAQQHPISIQEGMIGMSRRWDSHHHHRHHGR